MRHDIEVPACKLWIDFNNNIFRHVRCRDETISFLDHTTKEGLPVLNIMVL